MPKGKPAKAWVRSGIATIRLTTSVVSLSSSFKTGTRARCVFTKEWVKVWEAVVMIK